MSRSFKHSPIMGISGGAQKKFKQQEHKRERTLVNSLLHSDITELVISNKKFGNEWASPRDGKTYFGTLKNKWPEDYSKWMRK